jgi:transcriptional regulator with XRE-family HTH domain
MENVNENLPQQIRFLRELQGYSQDAIASFLGISQQAYQKLESGRCRICEERLQKIAEFFELDPKLLIQFDRNDFLNYLQGSQNEVSFERKLLKRKLEAISKEISAIKELHQQLLKELD